MASILIYAEALFILVAAFPYLVYICLQSAQITATDWVTDSVSVSESDVGDCHCTATGGCPLPLAALAARINIQTEIVNGERIF